MHESDWSQPNPDALLDAAGPPLPDTEPLVTKEPLPETESLLSELGAFYPVVSYPGAQENGDAEDQVEQTIYAGLIFS